MLFNWVFYFGCGISGAVGVDLGFVTDCTGDGNDPYQKLSGLARNGAWPTSVSNCSDMHLLGFRFYRG